jgi:hypothetical protein
LSSIAIGASPAIHSIHFRIKKMDSEFQFAKGITRINKNWWSYQSETFFDESFTQFENIDVKFIQRLNVSHLNKMLLMDIGILDEIIGPASGAVG